MYGNALGDELDDRPPPTVIHVAPFREDSPEFMTFGTHAQRAAVISAGVGLSLVIFIFLAVFFEFDWYHHEKGIDVGALIGMLLFLIIGMLIHWYIVRGIKVGQPRYLVPFIVIYTMLLVIEAVSFIFVVNHIVVLSYLRHPQSSSGYVVITAIFVFSMGVQAVMLATVVRCRNFLEKRLIHDLEMRVAEKSKLQHPGIIIVFGAGDPGMQRSSPGDHPPQNSTPAPPSYENATTHPANGTTQSATAQPQRTVLQAEDGIL